MSDDESVIKAEDLVVVKDHIPVWGKLEGIVQLVKNDIAKIEIGEFVINIPVKQLKHRIKIKQ